MSDAHTTQADQQRMFADVVVGDRLGGASYPLPLHRLVMAAAGTRDFTAIHHNDEYARAHGAPAMYANTIFLQGMWERVLRDYIGLRGTIRAIRDFRLVRFTTVGSFVRVEGEVIGKELREGHKLVSIRLRTLADDVVTVGPGVGVVTLP